MSIAKYIYYRGYKIKTYTHSNYCYIESRPFENLNSARAWIRKKTKVLKIALEIGHKNYKLVKVNN